MLCYDFLVSETHTSAETKHFSVQLLIALLRDSQNLFIELLAAKIVAKQLREPLQYRHLDEKDLLTLCRKYEVFNVAIR